jgi:hypothetical protein
MRFGMAGLACSVEASRYRPLPDEASWLCLDAVLPQNAAIVARILQCLMAHAAGLAAQRTKTPGHDQPAG